MTYGKHMEPDAWYEGFGEKVDAFTSQTTHGQVKPYYGDDVAEWTPPRNAVPGIASRRMTKAELRELARIEAAEEAADLAMLGARMRGYAR